MIEINYLLLNISSKYSGIEVKIKLNAFVDSGPLALQKFFRELKLI